MPCQELLYLGLRKSAVSPFPEADTLYEPLIFPPTQRIGMTVENLAGLLQGQDFGHIFSLHHT